MSIAVIIELIVKSETPELLIEKEFKQEVEHYVENGNIFRAQYQVTFAAFNKVKFYLDFSTGVDKRRVSDLENIAEFTISKLKTSLLIPKGIIENVTYDINRADWIIYFNILLGPSTTQTSFIELMSYLDNY